MVVIRYDDRKNGRESREDMNDARGAEDTYRGCLGRAHDQLARRACALRPRNVHADTVYLIWIERR